MQQQKPLSLHQTTISLSGFIVGCALAMNGTCLKTMEPGNVWVVEGGK